MAHHKIEIDPEFEVLIPTLREEEYSQLKSQICREGCLAPLIVWEQKGILLDGHNRLKICNENNIPFKTQFISLPDKTAARFWIIHNQLGRRNLTAFQRAELALNLKPMRVNQAMERKSQAKGQPRGKKKQSSVIQNSGQQTETRTDKHLAKVAGVSHDTITKAEYIQKHADEDTKKKLRHGEAKTSIHSVYTNLRKKEAKKKRQERKNRTVDIPADNSVRLISCDIADACQHIEPDSLDWIITDPPYPRQYLPTFSHLAKFATHALKPGGSLICMSGQSYLPEVISRLSENDILKYHWTLAYLTPGGQATQLWERKVNTFWKPLLWFAKDKYTGDWVGDVSRSKVNDNDKEHHTWGQSVSGMYDLLDRFVLPGQVICDPFLGGGTTALAARLCNCRFIGMDIEEKCLETARCRLATLKKENV